jgi:hypothetical protein
MACDESSNIQDFVPVYSPTGPLATFFIRKYLSAWKPPGTIADEISWKRNPQVNAMSNGRTLSLSTWYFAIGSAISLISRRLREATT